MRDRIDFMKFLRVIVCVTLALNTLWSANQASTNNIDRQAEREAEKAANRILHFHERQQKTNQVEKDIENSNKIRRDNKVELAAPTRKTAKRFYFDKILFSNYKRSEEIPDELKTIIKRYTKKYISATDILKIVQESSNYFLSMGYSTTIVGIEDMDLKQHILILKINFGYINNIYINGKADTLKSKITFPLIFNRANDATIFNIHRIDQGLENINRVSYGTKLYIAPSKKVGFSDIFVEAKPKPASISASVDNSADKEDGTLRANLSVGLNDLLGMNDILTLYGSHRILKDKYASYRMKDYRKVKDNLYLGTYSIPFGWHTLSYTLQFGDIKNNIEGDYGNYTSTNQTLKHIFSFDTVIFRNSSSKVKLFGKINVKDITNKIENQLLSGSSGRYTSVFAGIDILKYIQNGYLYAEFTYKTGLPILGGKRNDEESVYKINYDISELSFLFNKALYHNDYFLLSYKANGAGSYSRDKLLYADKFFVGDEYTVRGFKESSVAWDLGAYLNNTLSFKLFSFPYIEPFIGLDFGYGRDYELLYDDFLAGVAFGLIWSYANFSADITLSKDIHKGNGMPKESIPIYARVSFSY